MQTDAIFNNQKRIARIEKPTVVNENPHSLAFDKWPQRNKNNVHQNEYFYCN